MKLGRAHSSIVATATRRPAEAPTVATPFTVSLPPKDTVKLPDSAPAESVTRVVPMDCRRRRAPVDWTRGTSTSTVVVVVFASRVRLTSRMCARIAEVTAS